MTRLARVGWRLLPLLLAGCGGPQSPADPAGDQAGRLWSLLQWMVGICGFFYLLVLLFLGWSVWRARGRFADATAPTTDTGGDRGIDRRIDRGLVAWASCVVVGLVVLASLSFFADRVLARPSPASLLDVRVTAHQWWWRIEYRDAASGRWIETANELHLPADRTARVTLGSADVIHSFWVPNVAGKMDVIPGRDNRIELTPRRVGWFRGQCAEFCGTQHAHMAFDVRVDEPAAFDGWLADQARAARAPADPALVRGLQVMNDRGCADCHAIRGSAAIARTGPDLTHVGSRRSLAAGAVAMSRGALQGWIAQPQALKPGTSMPAVLLGPADADVLARYLESLQ